MARKNQADVSDELVQRLDALIRLTALHVVADKGTVEGILLLGRAGLDRNLIAQVVGSTPGSVSVRLAEAKAATRQSRGTRKKAKDASQEA